MDPDFRARLESATHLLLEIVADCLDDDFHAGELLGIPDEFGVVLEAVAAAEIAVGTRSPFDPAVARSLVLLDQRPVEEQERVVRTALRRYSATTPGIRKTPPPLPVSVHEIPRQRYLRLHVIPQRVAAGDGPPDC
ncbi:hypothetical protein AQI95_29045 [Streptomyces yokosukanensis]|uniref:Uncharacterized protein n=1 Tax=Streptomyces yokosukanensis TaxID=67386 RepID=A0A101NZH2_9ACTN|nr:hypothetical protein [Streptomyces yokosukanensis]KUN02122.1 hypothetical protein AQI95_29045 [Streptomyces yokosukanensis]